MNCCIYLPWLNMAWLFVAALCGAYLGTVLALRGRL